MRSYERWSSDLATDIIRQHANRPGATLPILHALQEAFGKTSEARLAESVRNLGIR